MRVLILGAALMLGACESKPTDEQQAALVENAVEDAQDVADNATMVGEAREEAKDAPTRDAWVGKWIGVEGLVLTIEKSGTPGRYRLTNTYSLDKDATGVFEGYATKDGIAFIRPDGAKTLRASDGEGTGLKYLAGKKDCLTVGEGEGYCRD
jgi:hypothetical protein